MMNRKQPSTCTLKSECEGTGAEKSGATTARSDSMYVGGKCVLEGIGDQLVFLTFEVKSGLSIPRVETYRDAT